MFSCDWGKLEDIYYPHAAAVTEPVGQYLAGLSELLIYVLVHGISIFMISCAIE